jgi:UDP-N-acetylmuramyl pentapeptide phosphotransferase/UDP-N-acetylglucosamine-1-phosphate transferase
MHAGLLLVIVAAAMGITIYTVRKYQRERAREIHHHHHYESNGNGVRKAIYSDKEAALDAV